MNQLNDLITKLLGDLSKGDLQKIMNMCIIDVHAIDVVSKMIAQKVVLFYRIFKITFKKFKFFLKF